MLTINMEFIYTIYFLWVKLFFIFEKKEEEEEEEFYYYLQYLTKLWNILIPAIYNNFLIHI